MIELDTIRLTSALIGMGAVALLAWRTIGTWDAISPLARLLAIALGVVCFATSYGSGRNLQADVGALSDVVWFQFAVRVFILAVAIIWPWEERPRIGRQQGLR